MVILHDAIKTIQNGFSCFFQKNKNLFLWKKTKNSDLKKQVGCFFSKKLVFLNPDCLSILFVIFSRSHDLEQVASIPVATGGFGGLSRPKQSSNPPKIKILNIINQWNFC